LESRAAIWWNEVAALMLVTKCAYRHLVVDERIVRQDRRQEAPLVGNRAPARQNWRRDAPSPLKGSSGTAGSGERWSAGVVSGGSADRFVFDYGQRRRQAGRERDRQGHQCGRDKAGERSKRAAHRTCMVLAVLVGLPVRVMMSAEQPEQMPLGTILSDRSAAVRRGLEGSGKVEGKVDRHQRVESKR